LPDVPIKSFSLSVPGGRHGLLQASTGLCGAPVRALVGLGAQNGKRLSGRRVLRVRCGGR
ncbi:MAG TPA: hypothetical protein VHI77_03545, partial [Solirubrobacterales bacterium]|nr:hypothetical protein [Solirubrobacterales bacterium]